MQLNYIKMHLNYTKMHLKYIKNIVHVVYEYLFRQFETNYGLDLLRSLDLSQNQLSQVPQFSKHFSHLEQLEIGLNYFSELNSLENLKNLKHFSMKGCKIPLQIDEKTFKDNSKLESVNVTKCAQLKKLESKVFQGLSKILKKWKL